MPRITPTASNTDAVKRYAIFGVDGEGYFDTEAKSHSYDVFTSGGITLNGQGRHLQMFQIVDLIRTQTFDSLAKGLQPIFIGYFFNYDVTQMIRTLDNWQLEQLNDRDVRTRLGKPSKTAPEYKRPSSITHGVRVDDGDPFSPDRFKIDYLENKRFTIAFPRPESLAKARGMKEEKLIEWVTAKIQDVGTVFGGSFIRAMNDFHVPMTDDERAQLKAGKENRAINSTRAERRANVGEVIEYNRLEISLVYRLIATLYNTLTALGIDVDLANNLGGIGALASQFIKQKAKEFEIIPSWEIASAITPEFYQVANDSYFGGWAETLSPGLHKHVEQADITSAYPDVMRNLPSLKGATSRYADSWEDAVEADLSGSIVYVDITYMGSSYYCGPLPHRTASNSVLRPTNGSGVYLLSEVLASVRAGLMDDIEFHRGYVITPTSDEKPLKYMEELFLERIRQGKKTSIGAMLKLILNSQYGKFAQSIGMPTYANPIYASMITAGARIKILDAIATHPDGIEALLAVATDAAFFRTPHPSLDLTPNTLGAWEKTTYRDTFLLKPGIWGGIEEESNDDMWSAKTRGIGYGAFVEKLQSHVLPTLRDFTAAKKWRDGVTFKTAQSFSMLTLGEAVARNQTEQVGEFLTGDHGTPEIVREVGFNLFPKRTNVRWDDKHESFTSSTAIIVDQSPMVIPRSQPYDKLIGAVAF
jgi:hypothetical protein